MEVPHRREIEKMIKRETKTTAATEKTIMTEITKSNKTMLRERERERERENKHMNMKYQMLSFI